MKSILSLGIEEFCTVEVKSAIEDWLLDDLEGLCAFLKSKETPGAIKGANGYAKLLSLFKRCDKDITRTWNHKHLYRRSRHGG